MGAFGAERNCNNNGSMKNHSTTVEVNDVATQIIDTDNDDLMHLTSTMPVDDDDYLLEDAYETQLVNLDGDSQVVMSCAGETQMIDSDGETQALDVVEFVKSTPSECLEKSNAQDDAVSGYAVDYATKLRRDASGASSVTVTSEQLLGSTDRDFTSIRAESFRASGLAARARGANKNSPGSDKSSVEQQRFVRGGSSIIGRLLLCGSKNFEEHPQNKDSEGNDKLETTSKSEFGSTVIRRLFLDGEVSECGLSEVDVNHLDNQASSQNPLVGLSYADSQEPGEQSQAEALQVVDKFLCNNLETNESFDFLIHNAGKPSSVSAAKGSRSLAKVSIRRRINAQRGIYDWDCSREDECGGEFLQKKKELLFGSPKQNYISEPQKCKRPVAKGVENVADHESEKEQNLAKEKVIKGFYSDLRSMSRKMRAKREVHKFKEEKLSKNLHKEFDDGLKTVSMHRLADNDSSKDTAHVETIGPDTQLAAEAMENLCFEVPLAGNVGADCNKVMRSTAKITRKNRSAATVDHTVECLTVEKQCFNSVGAATRLAKRRKTTSISTSNEVHVSAKKVKNVMKRPCKEREKEKPETSDVSTLHVMELTGQMSENRLLLDEQPYLCSPVAHRTRKRSQTSCAKAAGNSSIVGEVLSDALSARVSRKHRTSAKYENVESGVVTKVRKLESSVSEKSSKRRVAKCRASDFDVMKHLKEKEAGKERVETSPQETCKTSDSSCITPPTCAKAKRTSVSPLCMGDGYHKKSCRTKLSRSYLFKELENLLPKTPKNLAHTKGLRKRKVVSNVRVLFSQHLDDGIVKQQQKILGRLGGGAASTISDATHFVADEFVRTRNMLEAIAFGKPVVTHLWLEGCVQASCLIDEKNYILRDARKEKDFGFSLPASLSRSREHPLLQGYKVFITTKCKPGKDILAYLVKAVHGLVVERLGRSVLNNEKLPDDLLILSCEDDYDQCIPFLEKGGCVYSSELLLNGIVKQKLEFERHLIFADKVKRTRSTMWLKKKNHYLPVIKS